VNTIPTIPEDGTSQKGVSTSHRTLPTGAHNRSDRQGRPPRQASPALAAAAAAVFSWHRPLVLFVAVMIAWGTVCVFGLILDPREISGNPIWAKPLKFSISLALYAFTLAWMLSLIQRPRLRRWGWWAGTLGAAASLLEIALISTQVIRGTTSHFNISTPIDRSLYLLMAGGVVVMYLATLIIGLGLTIFTHLPDKSVSWALRLGLIIGIAGLSIGFLMLLPTAQQLADPQSGTIGSHSVGGDDDSGGLFFLGWNTEHGDLRVAHFIGMHALQVIPLVAIALASTTRTRFTETTRLHIVLVSTVAYVSLTTLVLWQALRGQSIVAPDITTWVAILVLAATGAIAMTTVFLAARNRPERSRRSAGRRTKVPR
jgi:hypothetical protein